jgi:hypothetical protein
MVDVSENVISWFKENINNMKNSKLILIITLSILFASCSNEKPDNFGNLFGGAGRRNSYEFTKKFQNSIVNKNIIASKDISGAIAMPLPLPNGDVVIATQSGSLVIASNATVIHEIKLSDSSYVYSAMAYDSLNNIFCIDTKGILYSINYNGTINWKYSLKDLEKTLNLDTKDYSSIYSDLLLQSDGIVISSNLPKKSLICKVNKSGKLAWNYISNLSITQTFSADENENLHFSLNDLRDNGVDSVLTLSKEGKFKNAIGLNKVNLVKTPICYAGRMYFAGIVNRNDKQLSILYCYDYNGKEIWNKELSILPRNLSIANDTTLYFIGFNPGLGQRTSGMLAFDAKGNKKWQMFYEYAIPTPVMISKTQLAFAGTNGASIGLFIVDRSNGELQNIVDLGNTINLNLKASVSNEGCIILAGSDQTAYIKLDYTQIEKILY